MTIFETLGYGANAGVALKCRTMKTVHGSFIVATKVSPCRGGNYFDVPANARCAVRLGIRSVTYSDSRDGFRICLGVTQKEPASNR